VINTKKRLAGLSGSSLYLHMAVALAISIACSYAAAMVNARPRLDVFEKLLLAASFASFASIGLLSVVADYLAPARARTVAAAPLTESHLDRPIVGLRAWRTKQASDDTLVLQSWHAQHALWPRGRELTAEPATPGIHAFKSTTALVAYIGADIASARTVVGTVALWGAVIEHEGGWTAEKAYPLEIHCADGDVAAALRRTYGCETAWAPDGLRKALVGLEVRARGLEPTNG
jgi:hypothetical protein